MCRMDGFTCQSHFYRFIGPSKKKAKHNAAMSVLNQMMGITNGQTQIVDDYQ